MILYDNIKIAIDVHSDDITKEYSKNKLPILDWRPKAKALGRHYSSNEGSCLRN